MEKYGNPNEHWYYHDRFMKKSGSYYKGCFYSTACAILIIVISLILSSCKSIKYVPVETVRTEYVTKTDTFIQKDSVVFRDSVYIHAKGDTVWYEKWHTKYKDRIVTQVVVDSFIKTDTIQVPYYVEKELTWWQEFKIKTGDIAMALCLLIILVLGVYIFIRKKR